MSSFIENESTSITLTDNVIDELTLQLSYVLNNESITVDLNNTKQILEYCTKLMILLYKYDNNIVYNEIYLNLNEIYNNLLNSEIISPTFSLNINNFEYYILSHLCTSLQTYRILSYNKNKSKRAEVAGNRGIISFQLEKICKDLDLNTDGLNNELEVFDIVQKKILQSIDDLTIPILKNTPKILYNIKINDSKQLNIISKIEESLFNDFLQRRKMLIKRLDVTIQSFLWGKKSKGKEQDIEAAIQAQRQFLKEEPKFYRSIDALNAPLSLLYQHSKKVTEHNHNNRSLVKTIIIGAVPDRGGRTSDIRPKGGGGGGGGFGGGGFHKNKGGGKNNNHHHHNNKQGKNNQSNNNNNSNSSNSNKGRVVTMSE